MSKEVTDIMNKMNGDMIALQGMEAKISPPPPGPPATTAEAEAAAAALQAAAAPKPKKEDYDYVKKLAGEIEALCKDLTAQIDKEMKVPPPPEAEAATVTASAAPHSSTGGAPKK